MAEDDKKDPAQKMRYLINGGKPSPVARLPKKDGGAAAFLPKLKNDKKAAAAPEPELTCIPAAAMPVAIIKAASALSKSLLKSTIAPDCATPPAGPATGGSPLRNMASRCVSFRVNWSTLWPLLCAQLVKSGAKVCAARI